MSAFIECPAIASSRPHSGAGGLGSGRELCGGTSTSAIDDQRNRKQPLPPIEAERERGHFEASTSRNHPNRLPVAAATPGANLRSQWVSLGRTRTCRNRLSMARTSDSVRSEERR